MCFAVIFPFLKVQNVKQIFREAYNAPEECSTGRRILVYGILYNLFTEFGCYPLLGQKIESYRQYAHVCKTHMEIAMSQLDLFLPASYENILALLLAAAYAVELCKPSLCWILNSTAAGLAQHLGYHRISSMKNDSAEERSAKVHVFWFIYLLDKTLSLRLGRASVIQDWDMSLPYPNTEEDPVLRTSGKGAQMQVYWIKLAQIQGHTYEQLFSPAAFLKSDEERIRSATELVEAINQAWIDRGGASVLDIKHHGVPIRDSVQTPEQSLPGLEAQTRRSASQQHFLISGDPGLVEGMQDIICCISFLVIHICLHSQGNCICNTLETSTSMQTWSRTTQLVH